MSNLIRATTTTGKLTRNYYLTPILTLPCFECENGELLRQLASAQVLEQANSVSDDMGIPLFRAGDTVHRPPSSKPKEIRDEDGILISGPRAVLARRKPKVT